VFNRADALLRQDLGKARAYPLHVLHGSGEFEHRSGCYQGSSGLKANFTRALVAVLAGNAIYFLLMPHLPVALRHRAFQIDVGLLLDGMICTAIVLGLWALERRRNKEQ